MSEPLSAGTELSAALTVQAVDVRVDLGGQPVLHGVDLGVHAGETVALMGGNGSGKSTLVRSLVGLVPVTGGAVRLFDTPVHRFRHWYDVGYVPQRSVLGLAGATVTEVVASGRLARRRPFTPRRAADRAAVARALETVRLSHRAKDEMTTLSGGQQQRVLIARALAVEPRLLVLDEPVAGVDLEHQQVLADVFSHLVERGTSILVVLHEVGPIAGLVDRAVVLRDGRVVSDGPLTAHTGHHHDHGGHETGEPAEPLTAWPAEPIDRRRREVQP